MSYEYKPYAIIAFLDNIVSAYVFYGALYIVTFWNLWTVDDWQQAILCVALFIPLVWLTVCDLQNHELPNIGTLAIAIISFMFVALTNVTVLPLHVATGLFVTAFLWLAGEAYFRRHGQEGLGIGDAKLFGAGALLLGPWQLPDLILLASLGGILGYCLSLFRPQQAKRGIPFGPFIAYSTFLMIFLDPLFL